MKSIIYFCGAYITQPQSTLNCMYICAYVSCTISLQYEVLFCVQSVTDPSLRVVEDLRQAYPHVDVTVLTGGQDLPRYPLGPERDLHWQKECCMVLFCTDVWLKSC